MSSRATSVASVGNVRSNQPECKHCGKQYPGSCRLRDQACFKYGSTDHYIQDCLMLAKKNPVQNTRSGNTAARGRPPRNANNTSGSQRGTKDTEIRSEACAPVRTYAIRAREEASSPDVITGTFTLYDTNVISLIDPGSTHSYVCETFCMLSLLSL